MAAREASLQVFKLPVRISLSNVKSFIRSNMNLQIICRHIFSVNHYITRVTPKKISICEFYFDSYPVFRTNLPTARQDGYLFQQQHRENCNIEYGRANPLIFQALVSISILINTAVFQSHLNFEVFLKKKTDRNIKSVSINRKNNITFWAESVGSTMLAPLNEVKIPKIWIGIEMRPPGNRGSWAEISSVFNWNRTSNSVKVYSNITILLHFSKQKLKRFTVADLIHHTND